MLQSRSLPEKKTSLTVRVAGLGYPSATAQSPRRVPGGNFTIFCLASETTSTFVFEVTTADAPTSLTAVVPLPAMTGLYWMVLADRVPLWSCVPATQQNKGLNVIGQYRNGMVTPRCAVRPFL
jgi:hypothetical protein